MAEGSRGVLALFAVMAAVSDIKDGKIPNWLLFPTLGYGILLRIAAGEAGAVPVLASRMFLTVLVMYPFWLSGGLGAGDIKMLAVLALYMDRATYRVCALLSFLAGGVIALCLLLRHRDRHRPVPFAVPIGTGIMLCLLLERNGVRYAL